MSNHNHHMTGNTMGFCKNQIMTVIYIQSTTFNILIKNGIIIPAIISVSSATEQHECRNIAVDISKDTRWKMHSFAVIAKSRVNDCLLAGFLVVTQISLIQQQCRTFYRNINFRCSTRCSRYKLIDRSHTGHALYKQARVDLRAAIHRPQSYADWLYRGRLNVKMLP